MGHYKRPEETRSERINFRVTKAELAEIDAFVEKRNATKKWRWDHESKIDAILAAVRYANGAMELPEPDNV